MRKYLHSDAADVTTARCAASQNRAMKREKIITKNHNVRQANSAALCTETQEIERSALLSPSSSSSSSLLQRKFGFQRRNSRIRFRTESRTPNTRMTSSRSLISDTQTNGIIMAGIACTGERSISFHAYRVL